MELAQLAAAPELRPLAIPNIMVGQIVGRVTLARLPPPDDDDTTTRPYRTGATGTAVSRGNCGGGGTRARLAAARAAAADPHSPQSPHGIAELGSGLGLDAVIRADSYYQQRKVDAGAMVASAKARAAAREGQATAGLGAKAAVRNCHIFAISIECCIGFSTSAKLWTMATQSSTLAGITQSLARMRHDHSRAVCMGWKHTTS
eukprot:COSAG05_NODE_124_length_17559_cov_8.898643_4_plen_203_part_00